MQLRLSLRHRAGVKAAGPGDEVIVKPGLYGPSDSLDDTAPITIRGEAGAPRPVLAFVGDHSVKLTGSTLRHVEIAHMGLDAPALIGQAAIVDGVVVRGGGAADCAASLVDSTIRNSVVVARSTDGTAICSGASSATNTSSVRSVTAVAHNGAAIEGYASGAAGGSALNVVNTIARTDPQGLGLWAHTETAGAQSTITVAHSNYAKSATGGSDAAVVPGGQPGDAAVVRRRGHGRLPAEGRVGDDRHGALRRPERHFRPGRRPPQRRRPGHRRGRVRGAPDGDHEPRHRRD